MALPTEDISKRKLLFDALKDAPASNVAEILETDKAIRKIFGLTRKQYKLLIAHLKNPQSDNHKEARAFIGKNISEKRLEKLNTKKVTLPTEHERDVAYEEGREHLWNKIKETGRNLFSKRILIGLYKDVAETYALAASRMKMTRGERQALLANVAIQPFLINTIAGATTLTGATFFDAAQSDASAAINTQQDSISQSQQTLRSNFYSNLAPPTTDEFNQKVQEALIKRPDRSHIKPRASIEMGKQNVPGLAIRHSGKITYTNQDQTWNVPKQVYDSNFLTEQITGVPARYMFAVQALESSFNPDAVNNIKACGLSQFVPTTLHEKAYKYGELIGFPEVKGLIKRYVKSRDSENRPYFGYKPKNQAAKERLAKICLDTDFNTRLGAVNMMLDIGYLQSNLAKYAPTGKNYYPITELHGYTAHFSGGRTGYKILKDVLGKDGANHAYQYFSNGARNNSTNKKLLFVNGNKNNPRSTKQFMEFLSKVKGLTYSTLPDMRNFGEKKQHIAAQIERFNAGVTIQTASAASPHLMALTPTR